MGMFDDITCKYPLPVEGTNELDFRPRTRPRNSWTNTRFAKTELSGMKITKPKTIACSQNGRPRIPAKSHRPHPNGEWIEFSAYFVDGKLNQLHQIK